MNQHGIKTHSARLALEMKNMNMFKAIVESEEVLFYNPWTKYYASLHAYAEIMGDQKAAEILKTKFGNKYQIPDWASNGITDQGILAIIPSLENPEQAITSAIDFAIVMNRPELLKQLLALPHLPEMDLNQLFHQVSRDGGRDVFLEFLHLQSTDALRSQGSMLNGIMYMINHDFRRPIIYAYFDEFIATHPDGKMELMRVVGNGVKSYRKLYTWFAGHLDLFTDEEQRAARKAMSLIAVTRNDWPFLHEQIPLLPQEELPVISNRLRGIIATVFDVSNDHVDKSALGLSRHFAMINCRTF
jgi:hypothetical protein